MNGSRYWIESLDLRPHPEGGHYRETYRSVERLHPSALPARFDGDRSFATSIYFLLETGQISAFHRIASDEIWCFHTGAPIRIEQLNADGSRTSTLLGPQAEQVFQCVIPAGTWFGAYVEADRGYSLVTCVVSPGFDFADFELADREKLARTYPDHLALIKQLTHETGAQ